MQDFSSILSSINGQQRTSQQSTNVQRPRISGQRPISFANGEKLATSNTVAGVKRKSEEPQSDPRAKTARLESNNGSSGRPTAAPQGRFQLSGKAGAPSKSNGVPHRPASSPTKPAASQSLTAKPASSADPKPSSSTVPAKRGFASIMQKAKAAQDAAKATGPSGIKHKAVEKLTKRERRKLEEEAEAQRLADKKREKLNRDQSKNGEKQAGAQKGQELGYKGTMRKPAEPLSYKGTMRTVAPGESHDKKKKGQAQDKYGGYASWSDLSGAEDEEEDYDSEGSSDMEGGFDEVEREELSAARAARKEDQEALEEEERLKREKLDRKRKLLELSKSAASRKKY